MVLLVIFAALSVPFGAARVSAGQLRKAEEQVGRDWASVRTQYDADVQRWRDDPLLAPRDGGDGAELFAAHVRWEKSGGPRPVPDEVVNQLRALDGGWADPAAAEQVDTAAVDTTWLSTLEGLASWNLETNSPLEKARFSLFTEDQPRFTELQTLAKIRLMKGLAQGDARPAAKEVRELARLCATTETLLGEMVAVSLLGIERVAHEAAVRRGQDVDGWQPVSEADQLALKRLFWVAPLPYGLFVDDAFSELRPVVGVCAGLHEGLGLALYLRQYQGDPMRERYEALAAALAASQCRLRRLRGAWAGTLPSDQLEPHGSALCRALTEGQDEDCPMGYAAWLPYVKAYLGNTLVMLATPSWLKPYLASKPAGDP